ncbi:hypothetical protein [Boudabousia marimammalium]|uniref:Uncharacterized protein n=1 Tax=Boudabousia marimammalium TaxID=156892 RepID=A0A1Q5PJX7_9ACTO|nr:hypothetical protein [Boudabousia marimammalium]OKL46247.1 hypothetical protein BM477_07400 [Boudabousia marimammalium]
MGHDHLQLVRRSVFQFVILVTFAIALTMTISACSQSEGADSVEASYKPAISYRGTLYLYDDDISDLPIGAVYIGKVDISIKQGLPGTENSEKIVANYYKVGTKVFKLEDAIYSLLEDGVIKYMPESKK